MKITDKSIGAKQSKIEHPCRDRDCRVQRWACTVSTGIVYNLNTLPVQLKIELCDGHGCVESSRLLLHFIMHMTEDVICDDTAVRTGWDCTRIRW